MLARLLIVVATIAAGAVMGRTAVNRKVEAALPAEIEAARSQAITELDKEIDLVLRERLSVFAINLVMKCGLIGATYLLYAAGHLTATGLRITALFLIGLFLVRDIAKTAPFVLPALRHVRRHHWRLRTALVEFVAGMAFERAYARAMLAMETGPSRFWIAFSKYSAQSISEDVGHAVAEVARTVSIERAKWRVVIGAALAAVMLAIYGGFFWATVGAVSPGIS